LGGLLKSGVDLAVRSRKADECGVGSSGREREKEVAIDGNLCVLLFEEFESRLSNGFEVATGRCQLESNSACRQVDLDNVKMHISRATFGSRNARNAPKRMFDNLGCLQFGNPTASREQNLD